MPESVHADPAEMAEWLAKHQPSQVNLGLLAQGILGCFGGIEGLARELYSEYRAATKGSMTKARLLTASVDVIKTAVSLQGGDQDPTMDLSDEEVAAAAVAYMREHDTHSVLPGTPGETADHHAAGEGTK